MVSSCLFVRLPPSAALLVLSAVLRLTCAQVLPRESSSVPMPTFSPRPSPVAATPVPTRPAQLGQGKTICGYIGGDTALPATCVEGLHCAVDVQHGVVGCCPDGRECALGIFTDCVDKNSSPQTVRDPYVYTCNGGNVCYRNSFQGGFYQYGCGSASHLATYVATTASGREPLDLRRLTVALTATPTPLKTPVTIGTLSSSTSDPKSGSARASGLSLSTPSATGEAEAPPKDAHSPSTGAIAGGAIGGVAALVVLVALAIMLCRRNKSRARQGSGPSQDTHYIRQATHASEKNQDNAANSLAAPWPMPGIISSLCPRRSQQVPRREQYAMSRWGPPTWLPRQLMPTMSPRCGPVTSTTAGILEGAMATWRLIGSR